jgi:hypothetical protein
MFGKILLTLAVMVGAYFVIRARLQGRAATDRSAPPPRTPLVPPATLRAVAYGLVTVMVAGSLLWLYLGWEEGHEVVAVQVINANTGDVTTYRARRVDVEGRRFTTLDGRQVTLADVERMVLE